MKRLSLCRAPLSSRTASSSLSSSLNLSQNVSRSSVLSLYANPSHSRGYALWGSKKSAVETKPPQEELAPLGQPELWKPVPAEEYTLDQKPIPIHKSYVYCAGDEGNNLGHPSIYVPLAKPGPHACNYCGQKYIQVHDDHHH